MNKKLKKQIKTAFDIPIPTKRNDFLQSLDFPKISRFDFILKQVRYIRKRVWVTSCLLAAITLISLRILTDDSSFNLIWIISSMLPYISLMTVTEIARSASYNMEELEISCRFNFCDIVIARLIILSCLNMFIFLLIILSFINNIDVQVFRLGLILFVPFLLTCSLSFFAINRFNSKEAVYICGGISCFVGITNALIFSQCNIAFSNRYLRSWVAAFIVLLIFAIKELVKLIKKTEELQWSF